MSSSLAFRLRLRHLSSPATTSPSAAAAITSATETPSLSDLISKHDPNKASEISEDNSSPISNPSLELTVKRLSKSRRFSEIKTLLNSHKTDPKIKNEEFLCSIIRSYGVVGMLDQALQTYYEMGDLGTPRSSISVNSVLSVFLRGRKLKKVVKMFDEMSKRDGVEMDKVSYGILIKAYCGMGKVGLAIERLKEMEEKGVEVTLVTYSTILCGLYEKGEVEEAEKVWKDMVAKGCVDVRAYNVRVMNAHGGDVEEVNKLIEEMSNNGVMPDVVTYNYLMTSYCKKKLMDEAVEVFDDLESKGCQPNAITFKTLVFYLCKNGRFETAHDIFKKSVVAHKIPGFTTMKHLVEGLVNSSKVDEAKEIIGCIRSEFAVNEAKAWETLEKRLGLVVVDDAGSDESATVGSAKVASA